MRLSLFVTPVVALSTATGNAAIDKILEMLGDMESRGKKEKQEEAVAFAAFNTWCDNTQAEKTADIKASSDAITQFQAQIEQAQAQAAEAQDAIDEAISTIDATKGDLAAMKKVRIAEKEAFITEKTDLQDSIYACEKASEALSAVPEKAEAVTSFIQKSKKSGSKRWNAIQSLLETVQKAENPFTSATERKSNVVIDMIEKLKEEFSTELQSATKDESDKQHAYDMAVQEGHQTIDANEKIKKEQTDAKGEAEAAEGAAKKDLDTEEQLMADDKKYLEEITADCSLKKKDFESRQKSRAAELTAIAEAVSILKSPEVQKGAGHLDTAQSVGSFLQLRSAKEAGINEKIISFLRQRGASIHSNTLMQLAEVAGADPFVKIRKMIQELITRLEEEAKAELTKKGKCDKDMAENKAKIEEFTTLVDKLSAEIEVLTSEVAESKATKKRLTVELAELRKAVATAKKDRLAEKTNNEKVISESKAALDALDQAMAVLQNYYASVKGALIQVKQPEFAAGEYKGMGGGGVLGLLEVVKSQTDQLIRETTQSESDAATSHDAFMTESSQSEAKKTTLLRSTEQTLAQKQEDLSDKKDALEGDEGAKAQLAAYQKEKAEVIDPVCTVQGVSFEERNKKREEEIQSLSEALEILGQMAP
jgi:DNA repair exonuclease SbcCD ATPase subunit